MNKPTITQLAEAAGIARSTASRVVKSHPEAPRTTPEAFAAWHAANIAADNSGDPEMRAQKLRKLTADASLAEKRLEILAGDFISKKDAVAEVKNLAAELQGSLRFRLGAELPQRIAGRSGPEIKTKIRDLLDQIWEQHHDDTLRKMDAAAAKTRQGLAQRTSSKGKARTTKPKRNRRK